MTARHKFFPVGSVAAVSAAAAAATGSVTLKARGGDAAARTTPAVMMRRAIHSDDLVGTGIRDDRAEEIGEVDGLLVSPEGGMVAEVVDVGGILEVGAKYAVLLPDPLAVTDHLVLTATATRDALERARPDRKSNRAISC